MRQEIIYVLIAVAAYLLGSISSSYIFTKKIKHEDIREKGSGNPGTTNMLRSYGWKLGILTLVCDLLKAVAAALIGKYFGGEMGMCLGALFVIIGHNWSLYLKFKGGKGIAATTGVLLVIMPLPTVIIFAICVLIVFMTKIMSIGSLIGLVASAVTAFILFPSDIMIPITVVILAVLGFISHRENIKRLAKGEENKLHVSAGKNK